MKFIIKKKINKDLLFNVMVSLLLMLVVLDAVPSINSLEFKSRTHSKNKHSGYNNKGNYYYKNKYYNLPEEPILLEKSSKVTKDGFIKPIVQIPSYKTIVSNNNNDNNNNNNDNNSVSKLSLLSETSKLTTSGENMSEGVKLAATENYSNPKNAPFIISSGVDDVYAESTNANEVDKNQPIFNNTVKKYQEYRSAEIFEHGEVKEQKSIFDIKKKISEEIDNEEDETTKKGNKVLNKLIDSQKQSLKLNSTDDLKKYLVNVDNTKPFNNQKNNVYFSDNDLDYAVDKKIRETNDVQEDAFVSHNLKHDLEKNDNVNFIETKSTKITSEKIENKSSQNTSDLRLRNKLDHLFEILKKKIYDNPKDYDFYFKDTNYEFKQFLVNERIIQPTSYHVDDSSAKEKNSDFEKLKKLDNIEKQIMKENNESKKEDNKTNTNKSNNNDISNIEEVLNNRLNKEKLTIMNLKKKESHETHEIVKISEKHKDTKDTTVSKNKVKTEKSGNSDEEEDTLISKIRNEIFEQENGKKYNNNLFGDDYNKKKNKMNEKEIKKPVIKIEKLKAKLLNENAISASISTESKLIKDTIKDKKEVKISNENHIKSSQNNNPSFIQKKTNTSSTKKSINEDIESKSVLSEILNSMN